MRRRVASKASHRTCLDHLDSELSFSKLCLLIFVRYFRVWTERGFMYKKPVNAVPVVCEVDLTKPTHAS